MFTKCCETFTRTDVWWEAIQDGRSSSTESASAKWQVTSCNRQLSVCLSILDTKLRICSTYIVRTATISDPRPNETHWKRTFRTRYRPNPTQPAGQPNPRTTLCSLLPAVQHRNVGPNGACMSNFRRVMNYLLGSETDWTRAGWRGFWTKRDWLVDVGIS